MENGDLFTGLDLFSFDGQEAPNPETPPEADRIKRLDIYVGEIFSGSYTVEFQMLKKLYQDHPGLGRFALFRNHSKVYAGIGPLWAFGIQSSANINTNPRTENTCVTIDRGLFEFYKQYYDGIKSFE